MRAIMVGCVLFVCAVGVAAVTTQEKKEPPKPKSGNPDYPLVVEYHRPEVPGKTAAATKPEVWGQKVEKDGVTRWRLSAGRLGGLAPPRAGDTITEEDGTVWLVGTEKVERGTSEWVVIVTKKDRPKNKP